MRQLYRESKMTTDPTSLDKQLLAAVTESKQGTANQQLMLQTVRTDENKQKGHEEEESNLNPISKDHEFKTPSKKRIKFERAADQGSQEILEQEDSETGSP